LTCDFAEQNRKRKFGGAEYPLFTGGFEMLGWHVSVYRQTDGGGAPATMESAEGTRMAVWQTGIGGLDWLTELVKEGKAVDLGGNGYPSRFSATAEVIVPRIVDTPPGARADWLLDAGDFVTEKWEGKTVVDGGVAGKCPPDEWLIVEVWDES
jgi:hypothetical protein